MVSVDSCGHPHNNGSMIIDGKWLCISCVQKELSESRLFNKEFELRMEAEREEYKDVLCERFDNDSWVAQDVLGDVLEMYNELKAQHLGEKEIEDDDN